MEVTKRESVELMLQKHLQKIKPCLYTSLLGPTISPERYDKVDPPVRVRLR